MWRPVWYLFDTPAKDAGGWSETAKAAAVDGLPNPFVMLFGEAAILWTLFAGVLRRARAPLIVAIAFFAEWLPWALNPKGLEFYYYFYPSIVCLGPALALVAHRLKRPWRDVFAAATLVAALAMFAYFLPILVAGIGVGPAAFTARLWLPTWR
jgi:dolichyl-phosphate-mannose--protein O-mannosyl transferase